MVHNFQAVRRASLIRGGDSVKQRNIHRSIWCAKLFLSLAIVLIQVACSNNDSTSEGRESNMSSV